MRDYVRLLARASTASHDEKRWAWGEEIARPSAGPG